MYGRVTAYEYTGIRSYVQKGSRVLTRVAKLIAHEVEVALSTKHQRDHADLHTHKQPRRFTLSLCAAESPCMCAGVQGRCGVAAHVPQLQTW